jgi:hypothetical protein
MRPIVVVIEPVFPDNFLKLLMVTKPPYASPWKRLKPVDCDCGVRKIGSGPNFIAF